MGTLVLFTASFPYGKKETYLETEIIYLSKSFNKVEIFPHYYNNKDISCRIVPENVIVHKPALPLNKFIRIIYSILGMFNGANTGAFLKDFYKFKLYKKRGHFISWFLTFVDYNATHHSKAFKNIRDKNNTTFYFYWGTGWAYCLLNLNQNNGNIYFMRLHGGEAYLDRSSGYIPLRKILFNKVHFILPISNHLSEYLQWQYNIEPNKIIVSRLGVSGLPFFKEINKINKKVKIVSCSNLIPLKRVDLIIDALKLLDGRPLDWTHFGDGPELNKLLNKVKQKKFKTISVTFSGRVENIEILSYYKQQSIDAFINVSKYEGLPVSLMEAMAYGIPCIATDAGATKEIVNDTNGILLPNDLELNALANAIEQIWSSEWNDKKEESYNNWKLNFNSNNNYKKLCNALLSNGPIKKSFS
ncbi:MAG: glycosyltransferase [Crocinitomicaceae bacterium]